MPWSCPACHAEVAADTTRDCPACGQNKDAWTINEEYTRALVVRGRRFTLCVGEQDEAPEDPGALALRPATCAPAVAKAYARALADEGGAPSPKKLLYVCLHTRKPGERLEAEVEVLFAGQPSAPQEVTREPAPEALGDGSYPIALLCVFGDEDVSDVELEGVTIVDVSEGEDHAPSLEVSALKRPAQELPLSAGHVFELAFHLGEGDGNLDDDRFELVSDDGGYEVVRLYRETVPLGDGQVLLRYEKVLDSQTYTLTHLPDGETRVTLFAGVSGSQLGLYQPPAFPDEEDEEPEADEFDEGELDEEEDD